MTSVEPTSDFRPTWWLRGGHRQTIWPALFRRVEVPTATRERLELPDGDFVDLDHFGPAIASHHVLVLHGLEGSGESPYIRGLVRTVTARGWAATVFHFRGCSGEPNRLARAYHSGDTDDLAQVVRRSIDRHPDRSITVVGFSLGGNVILKWLGESGSRPVDRAVAVSVPFDLERCASHLRRGASRLYQWNLIRSMRRKALMKIDRIRPALPPHARDLDARRIASLATFHAFDQAITAPLHGFRNVFDYYARCSSRHFLTGVRVPTLIVHALDDPFVPRDAIPSRDECSASVRLELTRGGGHVGFHGSAGDGPNGYWLERRIPAFIANDAYDAP